MELKEGMYVRVQELDYTIIAKVVELDKEDEGFKADNDMYYLNHNILKPSDDIIDLIEVGDYVNGYRVDLIDEIDGRKYLDLNYTEYEWRCTFNEDIKSIVTKEMFDFVKYEVE